MPNRAVGTFDVKLASQPLADPHADASLGRRSLDKRFHGDLDATSRGEMLSIGSAQGSGAYVAIERVTGTLDGRSGTFALYHVGVMTRGTPSLTITVAPDSGTDDLVGLTGTMSIEIANGVHSYAFEYELPNVKP